MVLTQVVTGLPAQWISPDAAKDYVRRGPELVVTAKMVDNDGTRVSTVVPGDFRPDSKYLTTPWSVGTAEFNQNLLDAGGVRVSPITLEVVVTGRRNQQIRILDIVPVALAKSDPLGGSLFFVTAQGVSDTLAMTVNFDETNPVSRETVLDPSGEYIVGLGEPYFSKHKITLGDNEQQVITMPIQVSRFYVEFDLDIEYLVGTEEKSLIVDNNGRHFHVTGIRGSGIDTAPDPQAPHYQRIYLPRDDFSLCAVSDPARGIYDNRCVGVVGG
jgi:hypothetical protein